jgi:hypothetical protein
MRALVQTALGVATVDLEEDEVVELDEDATLHVVTVETWLPRVMAADRQGANVVAVVDRRPPLMVSGDAGTTWREAGGGLPRPTTRISCSSRARPGSSSRRTGAASGARSRRSCLTSPRWRGWGQAPKVPDP